MRGILEWLSRFKHDLVAVRGAERVTIEEHERIFQAISSGDADGAATAMTGHLRRANSFFQSEAGVDLSPES
ncbi:FCD domain-containing protein [Devosia algicola]|uniref:FCD domain-containing protein n=1 Tax=Devosia algicola TaxID=3026418 RepID=A0ABY7YKC6_9HYPH|nr:FCD domain-containing protein [Devosia algicola]WDR01555.1 FCD domain-containing protein [Devosia algicola]